MTMMEHDSEGYSMAQRPCSTLANADRAGRAERADRGPDAGLNFGQKMQTSFSNKLCYQEIRQKQIWQSPRSWCATLSRSTRHGFVMRKLPKKNYPVLHVCCMCSSNWRHLSVAPTKWLTQPALESNPNRIGLFAPAAWRSKQAVVELHKVPPKGNSSKLEISSKGKCSMQ